MKSFFKKGARLETESLKAINEAYYESDDSLKALKCRQAKVIVDTSLKDIYGDYIIYQLYYKKETTTDYSYFFESIMDTLRSYLDYCELVLNVF